MPRGAYSRDGIVTGVWTEEQVEWLKARCPLGGSYLAIARELNVAFPGAGKSRSAVLAYCRRHGIAKEAAPSGYVPRSQDRRVKVSSVKKLAPVVFKKQQGDPLGLRSDAEPKINKHGRTSKSAKTPEQIAIAKKGHVPCVIEEKPLTSISINDCPADGCKWPTNDDFRCFEVCGDKAVIGAYCERHGRIAYREMPTVKRNREYSKRGLIDDKRYQAERKRIDDADAQWIADNVLDDVVTVVGDAPPMISHFIDSLEDDNA